MRVFPEEEPFTDRSKHWTDRGLWPAYWISYAAVHSGEPAVFAYRRFFSLDIETAVRVHVSADERYELFLDGNRIGRGPELGDRENWFFETYDIIMPAGQHVLVAKSSWMGRMGPIPSYWQVSVKPAFLLAAEGVENNLLNTGVAVWDSARIKGYSFPEDPRVAWDTGPGARMSIKGCDIPWGYENGSGDDWQQAVVLHQAMNASVANEYHPEWLLRPATLPPMLEKRVGSGVALHVQAVETDNTDSVPVCSRDSIAGELEVWNRMLDGDAAVTVPAYTMRRIIVDLGNYYCAYPEMVMSGGNGAKVRIRWAESLFKNVEAYVKGNRNAVECKYFIGVGDIFEPDGGSARRYETFLWSAGRYLEIMVSTTDDPLSIESLALQETHYPYEFEGSFQSDDARLTDVIQISKRSLEMCSHDTYMDCPYYERLMYVGDTRLQMLVTYTQTRDDRLPRKALRMLDASRKNSGITQSRYPSRMTQIIPPFSLWWVAMVHDYALWRADMDLVQDLIPGIHAVIDAFKGWICDEDLVQGPNGWNFTDWVPGWEMGAPPDGVRGISSIINLQFVHVLQLAAELEDWVGEPELASLYRRIAEETSKACVDAFWDESRGLMADDICHSSFSEHAQCLTILAGVVAGENLDRISDGLANASDLARTTIYFSHYIFETYRELGRMDLFFKRMELWYGLKEQGFKTTFETPEPSRSDCHAWGAHPVFHYYASVLGIRPASSGFSTVRIEPQLGPLKSVKGTIPHPRGFIGVDLHREESSISGTITLPLSVTGAVIVNNQELCLGPGTNHLD